MHHCMYASFNQPFSRRSAEHIALPLLQLVFHLIALAAERVHRQIAVDNIVVVELLALLNAVERITGGCTQAAGDAG